MSNSTVVTGGAGGIGFEVVRRFLAADHAVVVLDNSADNVASSRDQLESEGKVEFIVADVADPTSSERAAEAARELGDLGCWINNAGRNVIASIHEIDRETYEQGMAVNLGGVFWGTAVAVRSMLERGGGAIVNMSSVQALVGFPQFSSYAAAKGGIIGLTRQVAAEYADRGIRVNAIAPGLIATPMSEKMLDEWPDPDELRSAWLELCPVGRFGSPKDVAEAAFYLASDAASFVTGEVLSVNGGATVLARGQ